MTDRYREAVAVAVAANRVSTSLIQRVLYIGYNEAARLVERMEADGLAGLPDHAGKRHVLVHHLRDIPAGADEEAQKRSLALAAASQCAEALPNLVSFSREGESHPGPFGNEEPVEKLADALKMTIELAALCGDKDSDRDDLLAALVRYLEGWAG